VNQRSLNKIHIQKWSLEMGKTKEHPTTGLPLDDADWRYSEALVLCGVWIGVGVSMRAWGGLADRLLFLLPGIIQTVLMVCLLLRCDSRLWRSWNGSQAVAMILVAWILARLLDATWLSPSSWLFTCLAIECIAVNQSRLELRLVAQSLFYFVLIACGFHILCDGHFTWMWSWYEGISEGLSASLSPLRLRGTASGLKLLFLVLSMFVSIYVVRHRRHHGLRVGSTCIVSIVAYVAFVGALRFFQPSLWHEMLGPSARLYSQIPPPNPNLSQLVTPYDAVALFGLFGCGLLIYAAKPSHEPFPSVEKSLPMKPTGTLVVALASLGIVLFLNGGSVAIANAKPLRIGLQCSWDKTKPAWKEDRLVGLKYSGMYGIFLDDLAKRGCE
jgi:hypothetical protein